MLKKCCFCFNLYSGCLLIGLFRLAQWLLILLATIYITVQIYAPDSGLLHYRAKADIEANGHILFLILIVTIIGTLLECVLLHGLYKRKYRYFKVWYAYTFLAFLLSIFLAFNFILGILEIPSRPETGKNFIQDAMCILIHVVFFFIPEYLLGPRLTPVFIAIMILVHLLLPLLHGYSIYAVYSYLHSYILDDPRMILDLEAASAPPGTVKKCGNLCQKCKLATLEKNGGTKREAATPLINAIETTC
eukprot:maker-scaffold441_size170131-snap-gene-0.32 protein:Tk02638 transcript:maker-scaffold441_size170131-snap-gene-0.32-mRNA-1 annotation:"abc transporter permease"